MLISNHKIAKMLDDIVAMGSNPKDTATWILTDCAGVLRKDGKTLNDLTMTAETLATIIKMVDSGEINRNAGKKVLIAVVEDNADPVEFVKANGLDKKFDSSAIEGVIDNVIAQNEKAVQDFKSGKEKALMALFGACMKELRGAGDPAVIKELLEKKLRA